MKSFWEMSIAPLHSDIPQSQRQNTSSGGLQASGDH
jgi:hypothetical protein